MQFIKIKSNGHSGTDGVNLRRDAAESIVQEKNWNFWWFDLFFHFKQTNKTRAAAAALSW